MRIIRITLLLVKIQFLLPRLVSHLLLELSFLHIFASFIGVVYSVMKFFFLGHEFISLGLINNDFAIEIRIA